MPEPCSIREAARRLGCSRATLQRLLSSEASLARAVVGRGPRGSTLVSMALLEPAWRKLAGTGTDDGLSDRQRLDAAHRRRVWFDLQGWLAELEQLESGLVDAADYLAAHGQCISAIRAAAAAWAERVSAELPEVPVADAETWIERSVHDALIALIEANHREPPEQPAPRSITFPTEPPSLVGMKAETEATRARIAELQLQLKRGEVLDARRVRDQVLAEGLRFRDGWRRAGQQLAIRRRSLTTPEAVRSAALQELSRVGLA